MKNHVKKIVNILLVLTCILLVGCSNGVDKGIKKDMTMESFIETYVKNLNEQLADEYDVKFSIEVPFDGIYQICVKTDVEDRWHLDKETATEVIIKTGKLVKMTQEILDKYEILESNKDDALYLRMYEKNEDDWSMLMYCFVEKEYRPLMSYEDGEYIEEDNIKELLKAKELVEEDEE